MTPAEQRDAERRQRIANVVAAMQAVLRGEPDAREWLAATGLRREPECTCQFCKPTPEHTQ